MNTEQLKKKRLIGFIVGVLGLIAAYFGFDSSYDAHKELMKLDQVKIDKGVLK